MLETEKRSRFERLLRQGAYQSAWNYCVRLCRDYNNAEDLLQDSLTHAYAKLFALKDEASFRGWLMSIVRTKFLDRRRSQKYVEELSGSEQGFRPPERSAGAELIEACLRRLPEPQAELLRLYYYDELSVRELGQVLGLSEGSVKQRLHRAREALRKVVEPLLESRGISVLFE